jgi:hypothetical protein
MTKLSVTMVALSLTVVACGSNPLPKNQVPNRFAAPDIYQQSTGNTGIVAADFNGDGYLDTAMVSDANGWTSVMLGRGDGTFGTPTNLLDPNGPISLATADLNGDGVADLTVVDNDATLRIYLNDGRGTFGNSNNAMLGVQPHGVTTADFNGDGFMDIAAVNTGSQGVFGIGGQDNGGVSVLYGNGQGAFTAPTQYTGVVYPQALAACDVNGDGALDFVTVNSNDTMTVFSNTKASGTAAFSFTGARYTTGSLPNDVTCADLNGDGHMDVAVANSGNAPNTISVLLNNGDGTFAATVTESSGVEPWAIRSVDINGDGHLDLVVADSGQYLSDDGDLAVFINHGDGSFATVERYPAGLFPQSVAVGDFNGDGKLDVAVADQGAPDGMAVLLNTGA